MAKLLKLRRGSTTQHSTFTGAEGEVTVDTTKDVLVVNDGTTQGGHPLAAEDMSNVSSASIVNSIGTSALSGAKVQPNFGSQNVTTTGTLASGNHTVTGNIVVTGTVDGADIAAMNTKLNSIDTGAKDDQTAAEIRVLVEAATDSNVFTDADHNKLNGIAANATNVTDNSQIGNGAGYVTSNTTYDLSVPSGTTKIRLDPSDSSGNDDIEIAGGTNITVTRNNGNKLTIAGATQTDNNFTTTLKNKLDGIAAGATTYSSDQATNTTSNVNFASVTATGDVTAFSDQTLKKDIATINDALSLCGKLRGVSYKWIKDDKPSIGVIAQEIEAHIPEVVSTTQLDGADVKSVDYGKIVGVLINAVNELKAELDQYKGTYEEVTLENMVNLSEEQRDKLTFLIKKES